MKITIDNSKDNKRGVRVEVSLHPVFLVSEDELQDLLKETWMVYWPGNEEEGIQRSKLNRNSSNLQREI